MDMIFLKHLVFGGFIAVLSAILTRFLALHLKALDVPNERSSHTIVTPRGGGIAIVAAFFIGILLIQGLGDRTPIVTQYFLGFVISIALIASVSLYDDFKPLTFAVKLGMQVAAIVVAMAAGIVVDLIRLPLAGAIEIGLWAYPLTFLWMLGLTNVYNFIDGLDGFAASTAVVAAAFFAYITYQEGSHFIYLASLSLAAASLGFLVFNWPPAKIFMGDVGSTFLGLTFAVMAVIAARYDHSHTSFLVMPLLLLHFIFDATFTFFRRMLAGENVFSAHRTHLYQLLNRSGYSHKQVTLLYACLAVMQGLAAIWMMRHLGESRGMVYFPFILLYCVGAHWTLVRARQKGIVLVSRKY